MWPLAGTVLLLGGILPSALVWLAAADGTNLSWQTAAVYNATDAVFSVAAIALLVVSVKYGNSRFAALHKGNGKQQPAPYPGAWVEPDGHQAIPLGFPYYLALAFVVSIVTPSLLLAYCLLSGDPTLAVLGSATLAPYILVFLPQILLETRFFNRSFMTPVVPIVHAYYRFWQLIRSLGLVVRAGVISSGMQYAAAQQQRPLLAAGQYAWLLYYLLSLLCFWAFDSGCTMAWLPGMFEWQLQDAGLLARLSKQRQQKEEQRQQQRNGSGQMGAAAGAAAAAGGEGLGSGPAMAAKLRHRWRLAGSRTPAGSGDMDAYTFGS